MPPTTKRTVTTVTPSPKKRRRVTMTTNTAATLIQKAFRNRRRRTRRIGAARIGVGKVSKAKKFESERSTNVSMSTRTLYQWPLLRITKGDNLDQRERDLIHLTGFRLDMELKGASTKPIYYNIALVYDRRSNDGDNTITTADFFHSLGGNARALDFAVGLASFEFHRLPLNTDRFTVVKHWRGTLTQQSGTAYLTNSGNSWKSLSKWVPLKRKIAYEDGNPQSDIWLLVWCDRFEDGLTVEPVVNTLFWNSRVTTYFKELLP